MTIVPLPDGLVGIVMPNNANTPFLIFDARSIIGRRVTTDSDEGTIIAVDIGPNGMRATIRLNDGVCVRVDMVGDCLAFVAG